jgi:uncharacterized protein
LQYDVQIGVSVDGPDWLHDATRTYRNGRASHGRVSQGIARLVSAGIQFSVISVLTAKSLHYPDEIFQYLLTLPTKRGFAFNVDENDGANTHSSILGDPNGEMRDRVRRFFGRILELNEKSGRPLDIRDFTKYQGLLDGRKRLGSTEYSSMVRPGALIDIDQDGNISTFCPELLMGHAGPSNKFVFGNVHTCGFAEMETNASFRSIAEEIRIGRELCRNGCEYFMICGGGSPSNKFSEFGRFDVAETSFCRHQIKAVADAVLDHVEKVHSGKTAGKNAGDTVSA